jgi:hypothetical protein
MVPSDIAVIHRVHISSIATIDTEVGIRSDLYSEGGGREYEISRLDDESYPSSRSPLITHCDSCFTWGHGREYPVDTRTSRSDDARIATRHRISAIAVDDRECGSISREECCIGDIGSDLSHRHQYRIGDLCIIPSLISDSDSRCAWRLRCRESLSVGSGYCYDTWIATRHRISTVPIRDSDTRRRWDIERRSPVGISEYTSRSNDSDISIDYLSSTISHRDASRSSRPTCDREYIARYRYYSSDTRIATRRCISTIAIRDSEHDSLVYLC